MTFQERLALVVVGGILYVVGQYVVSEPQRAEQEVSANREVAVNGKGMVAGLPNVAQVTVGVTTGTQPTAEAAMKLLTASFNNITEEVKAAGIDEKDVQTAHLSINPVYDFREGQQTLQGFEAAESVMIKIRKLDNIGAIVSGATRQGANQVGGIQFVIDEPAELELEAQLLAIENAKKNAQALAQALGVSLGRVKSFDATSSPPVFPPFYATGELAAKDSGSADIQVPTGTNEISSTVYVTYELK